MDNIVNFHKDMTCSVGMQVWPTVIKTRFYLAFNKNKPNIINQNQFPLNSCKKKNPSLFHGVKNHVISFETC